MHVWPILLLLFGSFGRGPCDPSDRATIVDAAVAAVAMDIPPVLPSNVSSSNKVTRTQQKSNMHTQFAMLLFFSKRIKALLLQFLEKKHAIIVVVVCGNSRKEWTPT